MWLKLVVVEQLTLSHFAVATSFDNYQDILHINDRIRVSEYCFDIDNVCDIVVGNITINIYVIY